MEEIKEILSNYDNPSIWSDLKRERGDLYYGDDVLKAMEEYGKLMYNQAIDESLGLYVRETSSITDRLVDSILKLKK